MAAAIVELNALANAVGPSSQDEHLLLLVWLPLVLLIVGRVHVRSGGLELGCACVHTLEGRDNVEAEAVIADFLLGSLGGVRNLTVAVAAALELEGR